ncbi:MAG: hypothetical protein K5924_08760 [Chloroflexi bacterium]|nr:hypothetical protein [Chloroflexota bacterium]
MGIDQLRRFLVAAFLLGFIALYAYFLLEVVRAPDGAPPALDERLVGIGAILSGALGSAFAVALGVEDQTMRTRAITMPSLQTLLGLGLWAYALVAMTSIVVFALNLDETPVAISSLALVLVGFVAAIVTNAYKAVLPK